MRPPAMQFDAMSRESASEEQELDDEMELDSNASTTASIVEDSEFSSSYRLDESDELFCDKYVRENNKEQRARVSEELTNQTGRSRTDHLQTNQNESNPIMLSKKKPNDDAKDCTDAETNSQISRATSEDSKSYSQVYSEIYEESVARQKNAESICKFYITNRVKTHFHHVHPTDRTKHWVNGIEEGNLDHWTTEASDYSENISLAAYEAENEIKSSKGKYKTPIKAPIDRQPTRKLGQKAKPPQDLKEIKLKHSEKTSTDNAVKIKCSDQSHKFYSEASHIGNFTNKRTEKLKFDHCEIYHVKPLIKNKSEALTNRVENPEHRLKNQQELITEVVSAFISNSQLEEVYKGKKLSARAESKYIDQPESCRNKNKTKSHSKNLKNAIPKNCTSSARTLNSSMEYPHEISNENEINNDKISVSDVEFNHLEHTQSWRSGNEQESHSKNIRTSSARKVQGVKNDYSEISYHGKEFTVQSEVEIIENPEYFRNETEIKSEFHLKKHKNHQKYVNKVVSSNKNERSFAEDFQKTERSSLISNESVCYIMNNNNHIGDELYSTDRDVDSSYEQNEDIEGQYMRRSLIPAEYKHMEAPKPWKRTNKLASPSSAQSVLSSEEDFQAMEMKEDKFSNRAKSKLVRGRDSWRSRTNYVSDDSVLLAEKPIPDSFKKQIVRKSMNSGADTDQSNAKDSHKSLEQGSNSIIDSIAIDDSVKSFKKITYRKREANGNCNSYTSDTYEDSSLQDYERKPMKNLRVSEKWNKKKNLRKFQYQKIKESSKIAEDETVCSETSSYQHEVERSRQRIKSVKGSTKRHKSQNMRTSLVTPYDKGTIFKEYDSGSTTNCGLESKRTPVRRRASRSRTITPLKTYRDHACSPIRTLNIKQSEEEDEISVEMPQSGSSSKSEIKNEFSQSSISSDDKSMQYPTDDELGNKKIATKKLSGSENDTEILDIPLTPCSDSKLDISTPNSSYSSYRSSIGSMSNYVPSVRFYRRTHPEDDDETVPIPKDSNDSGPLSYKQHVALLAERALRACTNYYSEEPVKVPNDNNLLPYDPEKYFTAINSQRKLENSLQ